MSKGKKRRAGAGRKPRLPQLYRPRQKKKQSPSAPALLRWPSPNLTTCIANDRPLSADSAESSSSNPLMRSAKAVISEKLAQLGTTTSSMTANAPRSYTTTSLKRWSVLSKELPSVSQIRAIHVYDFDNTLFLSPLPNPQLWNGATIGFLQAYDSFANGGWWHDPTILAATGSGAEVEELRGWQGCWNEQIIRLVRLSMEQKDALTVLLTGRGEANFGELIKRMVASQNLDFDLVGLKPEVGPNGQRFKSTMNFKQNFLQDLLFTYKQAEEIRVYEDRVKHVSAFRDFFEEMNRNLQNAQHEAPRMPMTAEVIQVSEDTRYLDPATEVSEVQRMINSHNLSLRNTSGPKDRIHIKRTVFYTGYLLSAQDSHKMVEGLLVPLLPPGMSEANNLKYMANSILISPRPAPKSILEKIGGMGKKLSWQVTGTGCYENRVWAARVRPIPATETVHTENSTPLIVLAVRKGSRPIDAGKIQNWHPVPAETAMTFEAVIGEKVVLRVEADNPQESEWESQSMNKSHKRRFQDRNEEILYPQSGQTNGYEGGYAQAQGQSQGQSHGYHPYQNNRYNYEDGPRRGSGRGRGRGNGRGRGARGGRGRGRGGSNPYYKSLDDQTNGNESTNDSKGGNTGGGFSMDY